jgi:hypothetical protein
MEESQVLNRIEHHLLSKQVDDIEPLFILYADTIRDIEGANLDLILLALIKLTGAGYSNCTQKKWGKWRPCKDLSIETLRRRFTGLSEQKRRKYPMRVSEYYFQATKEGRLEEAKEIYSGYYPQG